MLWRRKPRNRARFEATLSTGPLLGPRADAAAILLSLTGTMTIPTKVLAGEGEGKVTSTYRYTDAATGTVTRGYLVVASRTTAMEMLRREQLLMPPPPMGDRLAEALADAVTTMSRFPRVLVAVGQVRPPNTLDALRRSAGNEEASALFGGNPSISLAPLLDALEAGYGSTVKAPDLRPGSKKNPETLYAALIADRTLTTLVLVANAATLGQALARRVEEKTLEEVVKVAAEKPG